MALKFEITGDNSNLLSSLDGAREGVRRTARDIEESGLSIEDMFKRVGAAAGIAFSLDQAKNFVKSVMYVRGQFQQLEIAFKTMLQSEEKATMLMNQLVETAAKTPFDLQGVAQGAKQLLAYGTAADEVNETITRLGDIAAGLSIPLGDLVYLYGTTMTQGRMFTMDLRQFMGRGIPMAEELAKQFGVTKNEVAGLVTAGKVGADAVKQAIWSMTDEGSKFGGLMSEQSKSITGQISNIEDAFDTMLNDIGKRNEGVINDGLAGVSLLIENYEEVGRVLLALVAAYGEYKAALMVTSAIKNAQQKYTANTELKELQSEIDAYNQILNKQKESVNADLDGAVAKGKLTEEQARLIAAKREELALLATEAEMKKASAAQNVNKLAEELDLAKDKLAIAVEEHQAKQADLSLAQQRLAEADESVKKAQELLDLQKEINDYEGSDITDDGGAYDELQAAISEKLAAAKEVEAATESENSAAKAVNTAETNVNTLSEQLNTAQTELNTLSRGSSTIATETNTIAEEVNTASGWKNIAMQKVMAIQHKASAIAQSIFTAAANECRRAWDALKLSMATNPIGLVASAITLALPFILQWASATDDATESARKFGEAIEKETSNARTLISVIQKTSKESKVNKDATEELARIALDYGFNLDKEKDKTEQLIAIKDQLIAKIKEEAKEREYANQLADNDESFSTAMENFRNDLKDEFGNAINKYQKTKLASMVSDEDLQKIILYKEELENVSEQFQKGLSTSGQLRKAQEDFNNSLNEVVDTLAEQASGFGKNEKESTKLAAAVNTHRNAIRNIVYEMAKEKIAYEDSKVAISDAYTEQVNWNNAQEAAAAQAAMAKTPIDNLYSSTKNLIEAWAKQYHLDLVVTVDDTGVPEEWKNATVSQLKREVARRNAFASQMEAKYGNDWVNRTYYDKQTKKKFTGRQWLEEGANINAKMNRDKPIVTKKSTTTTPTTTKPTKTKSKGGSGSKWDAAEHKANAEEALKEWKEELEDFTTDLINDVTDMNIANLQDSADKTLQEIAQSEKKEIKALEDSVDELIEKKKATDKRVWMEGGKDRKDYQYKEKTREEYLQEIYAESPELQEAIASQRNAISEKYAKERKKANEEKTKELYDYLKEYGSVEQQRLAITQEYEEKIANAMSPTKRASLMLERNKSLEEFDAKQFEENIDWAGIFSDLQDHTQEYLIGLRDQLQGVLNEGNLTPEQMSVVQEKLRDLNDEISKQNGLFQFQGDRAREHTRLVQEADDAEKLLVKAKNDEADAQKNVLDVTNQIRDVLEGAGIDRDTDIDDEILSQFDPTSEEYKQMSKLLEQLRIGEGNLAKARRGTADATKKAKNAEDAKQRESSQAVADWFADAQQFITEKGIDQIPALFDELGLGDVSEKVSQGLAGFKDAAGAAADFASGNYIGAAVKGFSAIKNFANMLGIGGDSDKHLQEDIERLTASNEALKYSIDELADKMSESAVADAEAIYKQQKDQLAQSEKNTQEMMSRSAAAYSNGFLGIGGKHSSTVKINDSVSSSEWDRISKLLGKNVRGAGEFFNLTSEQMYKVAVELPDVYAHIKDLADNGYKDAAQFMDTYIDYARQREELEKAYMEKLTSVSFDSIQNEFASALMDMDSDAETFAESFEKYLQQAIINSLVSEQYKPLLEKWYNAFGSFMSDGGISEAEMRQLRETGGTYYDPTTGRSESFQSWSSMSDSALAMRDTLKDVFGWNGGDYKQEASSKGFQSMSQETAEELNGRFTALQIAGESIAANVISIFAQMQLITQTQTSSNNYLQEIRNMMITSNSYLEDITKYSKGIYKEFGAKIDALNQNTEDMYNAIRRA